jgi:hypothetical protein
MRACLLRNTRLGIWNRVSKIWRGGGSNEDVDEMEMNGVPGGGRGPILYESDRQEVGGTAGKTLLYGTTFLVLVLFFVHVVVCAHCLEAKTRPVLIAHLHARACVCVCVWVCVCGATLCKCVCWHRSESTTHVAVRVCRRACVGYVDILHPHMYFANFQHRTSMLFTYARHTLTCTYTAHTTLVLLYFTITCLIWQPPPSSLLPPRPSPRPLSLPLPLPRPFSPHPRYPYPLLPSKTTHSRRRRRVFPPLLYF